MVHNIIHHQHHRHRHRHRITIITIIIIRIILRLPPPVLMELRIITRRVTTATTTIILPLHPHLTIHPVVHHPIVPVVLLRHHPPLMVVLRHLRPTTIRMVVTDIMVIIITIRINLLTLIIAEVAVVVVVAIVIILITPPPPPYRLRWSNRLWCRPLRLVTSISVSWSMMAMMAMGMVAHTIHPAYSRIRRHHRSWSVRVDRHRTDRPRHSVRCIHREWNQHHTTVDQERRCTIIRRAVVNRPCSMRPQL